MPRTSARAPLDLSTAPAGRSIVRQAAHAALAGGVAVLHHAVARHVDPQPAVAAGVQPYPGIARPAARRTAAPAAHDRYGLDLVLVDTEFLQRLVDLLLALVGGGAGDGSDKGEDESDGE